jgi:phosphate transport system permease protein
MWTMMVLALIPLALITVYVVRRGFSALSVDFFTKEPAGPLDPNAGGIAQAFLGSGIIVGIASIIAIPLGILTAVYLSEYGDRRSANVIRFIAEILLSTPSIIAGVFIWTVVVVAMGHFSGFAGALSLVVIMWPIIARATEEVLRLVSHELREGALALGVARWRVVLRIVIPTAGTGILTAVMLAVARGLGETAPILLTALGNDFISTNPSQPMDAVPLRVFDYAGQPIPALVTMAWGGALSLLVVVLVLTIGARIIAARRRRRLA